MAGLPNMQSLTDMMQKMFSQGGNALGLPPAQQAPEYSLMGRRNGNKDANNKNPFGSFIELMMTLLQSFVGFGGVFKQLLKVVNPEGAEVDTEELLAKGCHPDDAGTLLEYLNTIKANNPDMAKSLYGAIRQDSSPQLGNSWVRLLKVLFNDPDTRKDANQLLASREAVAQNLVHSTFGASNGVYNDILRNITEVGFEHDEFYQRANVEVRHKMLQAIFVAHQQAKQPGADITAIDNGLRNQLRGLWNAHQNTHNAAIQSGLTGAQLSQTESDLANRLKKVKEELAFLHNEEDRFRPAAGAAPVGVPAGMVARIAELQNRIVGVPAGAAPAVVGLEAQHQAAEDAIIAHNVADLAARHARAGLRPII